MDIKKDIERLEQKIDELSEKLEVILDRQNSQYTDIMLYLKKDSIEELTEDELYEEVLSAVIKNKKASTSYIQRRFRIGYARAAELMDRLEKEGVIGPSDGAKPREVLIKENKENIFI